MNKKHFIYCVGLYKMYSKQPYKKLDSYPFVEWTPLAVSYYIIDETARFDNIDSFTNGLIRRQNPHIRVLTVTSPHMTSLVTTSYVMTSRTDSIARDVIIPCEASRHVLSMRKTTWLLSTPSTTASLRIEVPRESFMWTHNCHNTVVRLTTNDRNYSINPHINQSTKYFLFGPHF